MATLTVNATSWGSGTSSYSQYVSVLHLGSTYKMMLRFDLSGVPAGSTVTGLTVRMRVASGTGRTQLARFRLTGSNSFNPGTYLAQVSDTSASKGSRVYEWDISGMAAAAVAQGASCFLHMYDTSGSADQVYDGASASYITATVTYTDTPPTPTGDTTMHRWDGSSWVAVDGYRWDGTAWVLCDTHRYDGGAWV